MITILRQISRHIHGRGNGLGSSLVKGADNASSSSELVVNATRQLSLNINPDEKPILVQSKSEISKCRSSDKAISVRKTKQAGNVGEWSELYALAYLLVHGGAFAGDEDQNSIDDMYYKILEISPAEQGAPAWLNYKILPNGILVLQDGAQAELLSRVDIEHQMEALFSDLRNKSYRNAFSLDSGTRLMELLKRNTMNANASEQQSDLETILEDEESGARSQKVGFNIKSQLGNPSTLLNASGSTNFIYRVVPDNPLEKRSYPVFSHGCHRANLLALRESGYHLEFHSLNNQIFQTNLKYLDFSFPETLARVLLAYYETTSNTFSEVVEHIFPRSDEDSRFPVYKLKEFLGAVSMGLRPNSEWDGDTTKYRGMLVVKTTGEVVFYYMHNRNKFQDYLYENVKFDYPSTRRHKYGSIYTEDNQDFIKLNLQIRFKK
jgi:type II restriction enzyme